MKKLTEKYKRTLAHRSRRNRNLRIRRFRRDYFQYQISNLVNQSGELIIEAPPIFSLNDSFDAVVQCINKIQQVGFGKKQKGVKKIVDFSTIHSLEPAAALVLSAEIDRWRRLGGFKPRPHKLEKWDTQVLLQFDEMGLFKLLYGIDPFRVSEPAKIRWIPFKYGKGDGGPPADQMLADLTQIAGPIPERTIFYDAITEALLNVANHAYRGDRHDFPCQIIKGGWWIAGAFDSESRELTGIVYDQGLGIPKTLPRSKLWEKIRGFANMATGSNDDGQLIKAAIEASRTSTQLSNRGLGLPQILGVIDEIGEGMLRVISGRGEIRYGKSGIQVINHSKSLGGTLIEWRIPCPVRSEI